MKTINEYINDKEQPINEVFIALAALAAVSLGFKIISGTVNTIGDGLEAFWDWTFNNK